MSEVGDEYKKAKVNHLIKVKGRSYFMGPSFHYQILINQIADYEDLLDWITQLCSKSWVTKELISELIRKVDTQWKKKESNNV